MGKQGQFLLPSEAARVAGVAAVTIRRALDGGRIDGFRTSGGVRLIDRESLQQFLRARAEQLRRKVPR